MKRLYAAAAALLVAAGAAAPALAEGPRASSGSTWPGISAPVNPAADPAAEQQAAMPAPDQALDGPRASSGSTWPGMREADAAAAVAAPQPAAPHYVWQEGYENGGKWHGHWVIVQ